MAYDITSVLALWSPGPPELLIILLIALLIFGRRLPEIARNMGKSMTEFKRGLRDTQDVTGEIDDDINEVKNHAIDKAKKASGLDELDKDEPS